MIPMSSLLLVTMLMIPLALLISLPLFANRSIKFLKSQPLDKESTPDWRDVYPHLANRKEA